MRCQAPECELRHCVVDRRHLADDEAQTCVFCLGKARADIYAIVDAYALLPAELVDAGGVTFDPIGRGNASDRIPGGDVLVLLAGGGHQLGEDDLPPVALLRAWEDAWRKRLRLRAAGPGDLGDAAGFLLRNLSWAAQNLETFPTFATDLRRCRRRLERATKSDEVIERGVPCPECDTVLQRGYGPDGLDDVWTCPSRACGRIVTEREHAFAVWSYLEGAS